MAPEAVQRGWGGTSSRAERRPRAQCTPQRGGKGTPPASHLEASTICPIMVVPQARGTSCPDWKGGAQRARAGPRPHRSAGHTHVAAPYLPQGAACPGHQGEELGAAPDPPWGNWTLRTSLWPLSAKGKDQPLSEAGLACLLPGSLYLGCPEAPSPPPALSNLQKAHKAAPPDRRRRGGRP